MQSTKTSWEAQIYRPDLPEKWFVEDQINTTDYCSTNFIKWMKIHHNGEPQKVYVVFTEHRPGKQKFRYTVRGSRKTRPDEKLRFFNDIKDATACLIHLMESTDKWCEEINSPKHIKAYNDRIAKFVEEEEKRIRAFEAAMADRY